MIAHHNSINFKSQMVLTCEQRMSLNPTWMLNMDVVVFYDGQ